MSRRNGRVRFPPGAVDHLRDADTTLREVIDRVGAFQPAHEPDLWRALVDAIISQQVSVAAATAIFGRVAVLTPNEGFPAPADIAGAPDEVLRGCGLSRAKVRYAKDLAGKWLDGTLPHASLPQLGDEEVIAELTRVKGIGRWTAEMILLFHLQRPDVLPVDDLGLRIAVQRSYGLPERPGRTELERIGEPWRPFRSVATLYLWQSLR